MGSALVLLLLGCPTPETPIPTPPVELRADAGPDRIAPIGVAVELDGSGSTGAVAYNWDFGDGTRSDEVEPIHIYTEPGNYTAILQVTGADGATRTATTKVIAHPVLAEIPPSTSSTLWVGDDGRVWGVVRDTNEIFVASEDGAVVMEGCSGGGTLAITAIPQLTALCDGENPRLLHYPFGSNLADPIPLPSGSRPRGLAYRDGTWTVSLAGTGQVLTHVYGEEPVLREVGPDPRSVVVTEAGTVSARFRSAAEQGALYGPDGDIALAYDPGPDTDTGNRGVPNLLTLAGSPDGRTVFVAGTLSNTARGGARDGQALTFETTVRAFVAAVDLDTGEELYRRQLDEQGRVGSMVVSPLGNLLYCVFPSTQSMLVLNAFTGETAGRLVEIGHGIDGVALSADGDTVYVNATLDREIRAYDVRDLAILPPLLWAFPSVREDPMPADVLRGKRLFWDSRDPRIARDGYIACETCHPEGDHDGQTWDFTDRGEGLRNTTSLLGRAGTGMGPVHWTGNFDEIQDFEHDIRGAFGGRGLMTDDQFAMADTPLGAPKAGLSEDLDALAAYVATLDLAPASPFPVPPGGDALFTASGCETCHPPPLFTDSALDVRHDIGTLTPDSGQRLGGPLDGLDTPTLLGAWDSGPWLHDGSAATLLEAIAAHADAPTDPAELELLTGYVRSL